MITKKTSKWNFCTLLCSILICWVTIYISLPLVSQSYKELLNMILNVFAFFVLALISFEDLKKKEISNWYNGLLFFIGVAGLFLNDDWKYRIITSLVMILFLIICLVISKGGLGGGDVKLISAVTLIFGFRHSCTALIIGGIGVSITGILCIISYKFLKIQNKIQTKKPDFRKMEFPFGPYFVLGITMIFWKIL